MDAWFRQLDEHFFRRELGEGALIRSLGFSRKAIVKLVERHARRQDVGRKLFALLMLEAWARRFA